MKTTTLDPKKDTDILGDVKEEAKIILINDPVNTFDTVIEALIECCNHTSIQAEQCTIITHHKGVCEVKRGDYTKLVPIHKALLTRGLLAEID